MWVIFEHQINNKEKVEIFVEQDLNHVRILIIIEHLVCGY